MFYNSKRAIPTLRGGTLSYYNILKLMNKRNNKQTKKKEPWNHSLFKKEQI